MIVSIDTIVSIVIGILVGFIFCYFGIRYTLRSRKKTEITFLNKTSISLFESIVKNFDDIEINYQGKRINENLILFRGTFLNNGNSDILNDTIEEPLEIEFPKNYNCSMCKLSDSSEKLKNLDLSFSSKKIVFKWKLLKEGEYFTFDSLVEYQAEKNDSDNSYIEKMLEGIKINHRIADLKNVSKVNQIPRPSYGGIFSILLLYIMLSSFLVYSVFNPNYKVLTEVNIHSGKQFATFKANNEYSVSLFDENGKELATYSKAELPQKLGTDVKIYKDRTTYQAFIIIGIFVLTFSVIFGLMIIEGIRGIRLYKKIKPIVEKNAESYRDKKKNLSFYELLFK